MVPAYCLIHHCELIGPRVLADKITNEWRINDAGVEMAKADGS